MHHTLNVTHANPAPATRLPDGLPTHPQAGDFVPIPGHTCPQCGVLTAFWCYNPFSDRGVEGTRWVQVRNQHCRCDEPARPAQTPASRSHHAIDLALLHQSFPQERRRTLSLANYPFKDTLARPLYEACLHLAQATSPEIAARENLYLIASPRLGADHLIAALTNLAARHGWSTLVCRTTDLVDAATPDTHRAGEDRAQQNTLRRAVRMVGLLGLTDFHLEGLLPSETRELESVLTFRRDKGLPTLLAGFKHCATGPITQGRHAHAAQRFALLLAATHPRPLFAGREVLPCPPTSPASASSFSKARTETRSSPSP